MTLANQLSTLILATACIAAPQHTFAEDYIATGWRKDALEYILQDNASIREALWNGPISFWVSRDNDGTRHDGFADYLCLELRSNGMPDGDFAVIKIWSHQDMLRGDLKEIGRSDCKG